MDDDRSSVCPRCGEDHPVSLTLTTTVPTVRGSRMRHGGTFTEGNITLGSGEWRQVRCHFCGSEAMTPIEMIPPFLESAPDGAFIGHCGSCDFDLQQGHRPGHNPSRRRRRRR